MLHRVIRTKVRVPVPKFHVTKNVHHVSLVKLVVFVLIFAVIGCYLLFVSFASTSSGTFGKTSIGASCDTFVNNRKRVNRYSVGAAVSVSRLNIYLKKGTVDGRQDMKGIIYADDNNVPGALIATSRQLTYSSTDLAGWYKLDFAQPVSLNAGNYWIGVLTGDTSRAAAYCFDTASSNVRDFSDQVYSAGPSNPFGTVSQDNRVTSIYASYTTDSSSLTFGKTDIGASCDTFVSNHKRVNEYSVSSTATISRLSVYLKPGSTRGGQALEGILYADSNGAPGALIAATGSLTFYSTNAAGWYDMAFAAPPSVNAGNYWIGIISGDNSRAASYCYDNASSNVRDYNDQAYSAGPSNPFGTVSRDNRVMSLNASYTANGTPPPSGPTVSLSATPASINAGQSSTLNWSSTNTSGCSAPWTTSKSTNGSQSVSPSTTTTYSISCSGSGGSASKSVTVSVSSGGGGTAPTASLTASPSTINAGQSSTLSWASSNAASCSATWTNAKATNGSQSVSPASTTAYSITCTGSGGSVTASTTVTVSAGGGGGIACNTTLSGSQVVQLLSNKLHLQSNEWGSSAPFSICTDGNSDFTISNSQINVSTSGAPGAYPSLVEGCHWGYCTSNSGLPVSVPSLVSTANKVTTTYNTSVISSGAWDDAYDNWYNPNSSTNNNSTGLEMMIWINHHGPIQPAGGVVTSNASIDGMSWTVWHGGGAPGGTVSYVLNSPVTAVNNMDLGPFTADSLQRGYLTNSWWLIDVEAGFEPWQGGTGLTANNFNVIVH